MANHNIRGLETELRGIGHSTDELLKIIHMPGYTTPAEFALVSGIAEGIALQMRTLVTVSKEIVGQAR